jgi:hypothetical protein
MRKFLVFACCALVACGGSTLDFGGVGGGDGAGGSDAAPDAPEHDAGPPPCVFDESRDSCGCCLHEHVVVCPANTIGPDSGVLTLPICN